MYLTGSSVVSKLNSDNAKSVLFKINSISRSHQIQDLTYGIIKLSHENNLLHQINESDKNDILETLYEYSGINSDVGKRAALLYAKITSGHQL